MVATTREKILVFFARLQKFQNEKFNISGIDNLHVSNRSRLQMNRNERGKCFQNIEDKKEKAVKYLSSRGRA